MAAASAGAAVRALAARLNASVVTEGRSLAALDGAEARLPERDRPLLKAMLLGSLRWHHRLDWQLGRLLDRPRERQRGRQRGRRGGELEALVRIGLVQLQYLRIPDHAAVSATVDAASALGLGRARGLVNAVLRRYLRERENLDALAAGSEVARFSHPEWLIDAIRRDWPDDWQAVLDANNAMPPLWLRVNRTRIDRDAYLARLEAAGLAAAIDDVHEDAVLLAEPCPVERLPGFDDGLVSVQDAAAQGAAALMQLAPGQRVLDACAAPGGKTAHMLERCPGLAELVALDADAGRLGQVDSNLRRLGLSATLVAGDAAAPASWFDGRPFDRVLVDVPCSATGVIRRHPDIKILRRAGDIAGLVATEARILDALWPLLAPGGLMVYVTCSILTPENAGVVTDFVARTAGASLPPQGSPAHFRLRPGETNTDGFYYACLTRGSGGH